MVRLAETVMTEEILIETLKCNELEYRVIAVNKTGESSPFNTVLVVL